MSAWSWAWLALLIAMGVLELAALLNKRPDDTLSEHVWKWFAIKDKRRTGWPQARRLLLLASLAWLAVHFLTGGRF